MLCTATPAIARSVLLGPRASAAASPGTHTALACTATAVARGRSSVCQAPSSGSAIIRPASFQLWHVPPHPLPAPGQQFSWHAAPLPLSALSAFQLQHPQTHVPPAAGAQYAWHTAPQTPLAYGPRASATRGHGLPEMSVAPYAWAAAPQPPSAPTPDQQWHLQPRMPAGAIGEYSGLAQPPAQWASGVQAYATEEHQRCAVATTQPVQHVVCQPPACSNQPPQPPTQQSQRNAAARFKDGELVVHQHGVTVALALLTEVTTF